MLNEKQDKPSTAEMYSRQNLEEYGPNWSSAPVTFIYFSSCVVDRYTVLCHISRWCSVCNERIRNTWWAGIRLGGAQSLGCRSSTRAYPPPSLHLPTPTNPFTVHEYAAEELMKSNGPKQATRDTSASLQHWKLLGHFWHYMVVEVDGGASRDVKRKEKMSKERWRDCLCACERKEKEGK